MKTLVNKTSDRQQTDVADISSQELQNTINADIESLTLQDFLPESLKMMLANALHEDDEIPSEEDIDSDDEYTEEEEFGLDEEDELAFDQDDDELELDDDELAIDDDNDELALDTIDKDMSDFEDAEYTEADQNVPDVNSEADTGNDSSGWLDSDMSPQRERDKNA